MKVETDKKLHMAVSAASSGCSVSSVSEFDHTIRLLKGIARTAGIALEQVEQLKKQHKFNHPDANG